MAASTWCEVFISHRGLDMKLGFANCLHHALKDRGIASFLDMETLTKGNDVRKDFIVAVQRAIVQVPILTDDFGTSNWCLDELTAMMDSERDGESTVIPVFFNLQPEDLRKEEGTFGKRLKEFLNEHKPGEERTNRWTNALNDVSWLEGFRLDKYGRAQGELISDLAATISNEIDRKCSVDMSGFVGLDDKVQEVVVLLCLQDTETVNVVLIWGMSGVGKTTLARAIHIYLLSLKKFEEACFIPNCGSLEPIEIQKKLLARLLRRDKEMDIGIGKSCLKNGLKRKKVLIILDDMNANLVEKIIDLKALCPGSRLLLTSRDGKWKAMGLGMGHIWRVTINGEYPPESDEFPHESDEFPHESDVPVLRCERYELAEKRKLVKYPILSLSRGEEEEEEECERVIMPILGGYVSNLENEP